MFLFCVLSVASVQETKTLPNDMTKILNNQTDRLVSYAGPLNKGLFEKYIYNILSFSKTNSYASATAHWTLRDCGFIFDHGSVGVRSIHLKDSAYI